MVQHDSNPKAMPVIPAVLAEHLEQFQLLWEQRQEAVQSPEYWRSDIVQLDARLEAHVDGLLVGRLDSLPLLSEALAGDSPSAIFAAAYVLLRMEDRAAADLVIAAFAEAQPDSLDGFRQAFRYGPIEQILEPLRAACTSESAPVAVVALEALVFHGKVADAASALERFFENDDPLVRQVAWRIVAMLPETGV